MIKGKIEGKSVVVEGYNGETDIYEVIKEYENGEVLYSNGIIGRVEDIKEIIK